MGVHAPQQCIANHEINSIPKSKELQADRFGTAKPISQEAVIVMTGRRKRYSTQKKSGTHPIDLFAWKHSIECGSHLWYFASRIISLEITG